MQWPSQRHTPLFKLSLSHFTVLQQAPHGATCPGKRKGSLCWTAPAYTTCRMPRLSLPSMKRQRIGHCPSMLPVLTVVLLTTWRLSLRISCLRLPIKDLAQRIGIQDFGCCTQAAKGCQDRAVLLEQKPPSTLDQLKGSASQRATSN